MSWYVYLGENESSCCVLFFYIIIACQWKCMWAASLPAADASSAWVETATNKHRYSCLRNGLCAKFPSLFLPLRLQTQQTNPHALMSTHWSAYSSFHPSITPLVCVHLGGADTNLHILHKVRSNRMYMGMITFTSRWKQPNRRSHIWMWNITADGLKKKGHIFSKVSAFSVYLGRNILAK